ncbi:hypothetical protein V5799_025886 [Amblyomma americanum]|uniref:Uncharacterized protein n=1 Tax=Amblyomma americanum TaxID=6943 RepID=A0AAQ4E860_AMBAM
MLGSESPIRIVKSINISCLQPIQFIGLWWLDPASCPSRCSDFFSLLIYSGAASPSDMSEAKTRRKVVIERLASARLVEIAPLQ